MKRTVATLLVFGVLFGGYEFVITPLVDGAEFGQNGNLEDVVLCATAPNFTYQNVFFPDQSHATVWPQGCRYGMYKYRGTPADMSSMNVFILSHVVDMQDDKERERMVEFWRSRGADINASTTDLDSRNTGMTLLFLAAFDADPDKVSFLLKHGADANIRDVNGETVLERLAARKTKEKTEKYDAVIKVLGG